MPNTETETHDGAQADDASALIDAKIKELNDWRGETLARIRAAAALNTSVQTARATKKTKAA